MHSNDRTLLTFSYQIPPTMAESTAKKYAVVTGANKGIGFDVCRQLASHGITVVLTARDENRGNEAVDKLNNHSGNVIFHQLDVSDSQNVVSLVEFVNSQFGKLDILVNNAGISGSMPNDIDETIAAYKAATVGGERKKFSLESGAEIKWDEILNETNELTEACLQTNYYGTKRVTEALLPLLQLSDSPRIVNMSSGMGKLKNIPSESIREILNDVNNLEEEKVNKLVDEFHKDFKEGSLEAKGWPQVLSAYTVSKAAINAYTRILAKQYPKFRINCVCPGYVKTDINFNTGVLTAEEGAETPVMAALFPNDGPTGVFIVQKKESSFVE